MSETALQVSQDREERLKALNTHLNLYAGLENTNRGFSSFVIDHGRHWQSAALIDFNFPIRQGERKQCFSNSQKLLERLERKHPGEFTYVEGYACPGDLNIAFPMLHAWLADREGRVIDCTWNKPDLGVYFGVPFETDYVFSLRDQYHTRHSVLDHMPSRWELIRNPEQHERAISAWEADFDAHRVLGR